MYSEIVAFAVIVPYASLAGVAAMLVCVLLAFPISASPGMYSIPIVDPCANVYSANIAPTSSEPVFVVLLTSKAPVLLFAMVVSLPFVLNLY